jgi:hypothetical protein
MGSLQAGQLAFVDLQPCCTLEEVVLENRRLEVPLAVSFWYIPWVHLVSVMEGFDQTKKMRRGTSRALTGGNSLQKFNSLP